MEKNTLKEAGLKVTLPRVKILNILRSSGKRHMNVEDVYKQLLAIGNDVGLATVYRVLTQFESAGLVCKHYFEDTERCYYELASEGHHDHMVCVQCDTVLEFFDEVIEKRQQVISEQHDFLMTAHSLVIYGLCTQCQTT